MSKEIKRVVWIRQARESLQAIFQYRYSEIPVARDIVKKYIINASKKILFAEQHQKDEVFPEYRKIIIRDYKILYKEEQSVVYILNVICTKAK
ncbi:MAG: type II toxin-antitoxin system RelE/ParE family toxin [Chitinophagales bacterium]|nr:type II toxin-antitoxin system RelE/ParE family toxin [Chitinophagales bacterium]